MIRSNFFDYSDVQGAAADNLNEKVIFKNCAWFTNCISEINNVQVDEAHEIDVVMRMCNLIEYSDCYSKILESLWKHYRDERALDNGNDIIDFLLITLIVFR